jgi:ADP-ribosylation factor GTPase-activating protein 2/3
VPLFLEEPPLTHHESLHETPELLCCWTKRLAILWHLALDVGVILHIYILWLPLQLKIMAVGGNGRARAFFRQHGWTDSGSDKIADKYTSRSAALYRQMLAREAAAYDLATYVPGSPHEGVHAETKLLDTSGHLSPKAFPKDPGSQASFSDCRVGAVQEEAVKSAATGAVSAATAKKPAPGKSKLVLGARKSGGSKSGAKKLGTVKKVETAVDESLFSQV